MVEFHCKPRASHGRCVCWGDVRVLELAYVCKEAVLQTGRA
jgi:hypothetical protein